MSLSLNPSESRTVDGIYNVLAIAFVFFAVALESQSMADGPQDRDALEKYLQSVEQISSFDIVYSIRTKHLYELKAGASPTSLNALQPLAEGEVPHEDVEAHRLVYKLPLGKRRVEELSPSYEPVAIGTYDGELVRSMRYQTALGPSGSIRGSSLQFLPERSDYLCYYRNAFTELPWKVLYTERKSVCRVFEENGYTVVELPPVEGKVGLSVSTLLVRAFLDKQTNQLRHYDVFDKRADGTWHLQQRVEIKEVLQLEGGARAVTAAVASRYFPADTAYEGQLMQVMELAVDNSRSKWNIPIDEDLFVLRYPEGVMVLDEVRRIQFVTGSGDNGKDIDRLIARANSMQHLGGRSAPTGLGPYYMKDSSTAQNVLSGGIASNLALRGVADVVRSVADLQGALTAGDGRLTAGNPKVQQLAKVMQEFNQGVPPGCLFDFAEIYVFEPHLTPDGQMVWQEVMPGGLHFNREFLGTRCEEIETKIQAEEVAPGAPKQDLPAPGLTMNPEFLRGALANHFGVSPAQLQPNLPAGGLTAGEPGASGVAAGMQQNVYLGGPSIPTAPSPPHDSGFLGLGKIFHHKERPKDELRVLAMPAIPSPSPSSTAQGHDSTGNSPAASGSGAGDADRPPGSSP